MTASLGVQPPSKHGSVVALVTHAALAGHGMPQLVQLVMRQVSSDRQVPYDELAGALRPLLGLRPTATLLEDVCAARMTAMLADSAPPAKERSGGRPVIPPMQRPAIEADLHALHAAVAQASVAFAEEHLQLVLHRLRSRSTGGRRLVELEVLRHGVADAAASLYAARALSSQVRSFPGPPDRSSADTARAAAESVEYGDRLLAGASVLVDNYGELRSLAKSLHRSGPSDDMAQAARPTLRELRPALAESLATRLAEIGDPADVRQIHAAVSALVPLTTTDLIDELVIAEVLAQRLAVGSCTRVLTQRLLSRHYPDLLQRRAAGGGPGFGALAITESTGGTDLGNWQTVLRRNEEGWRLIGSKTLVAGGADADYLLVGASCDGEMALALVPADSVGVTRRPLATDVWGQGELAEAAFRDCPVSNADVLKGPAVAASLRAGLGAERLLLSAVQLAYASTWLADLPADFGPEFAWRLRACQALVSWAAGQVIAGAVDAAAAASAAKLHSCQLAVDVASARLESLPAEGGDGRQQVALLDLRNARAARYAGGSPEAQRIVIALHNLDGR